MAIAAAIARASAAKASAPRAFVAKASAARPRANGSGSKIPLPPPSLQRARHTPASPSTVAVRHNSNVTKPSRLPVRSVAPARAPNSTGVSAQAPRNGKVSAPAKPAAAKSPSSLPKPKPATARAAASAGRQTKTTSSVRALPRASEPTAKLLTPAKPVVTKAAVSQSRVVPQLPKRQPAPIAPRTTKPVPAPAKSALPRPPKMQKSQAQKTTRPARPAPEGPKNSGSVGVIMQEIEKRIDLAEEMAAEQCCNKHSDPKFGRDPVLLSNIAKDYPHGEELVQCRRGRRTDAGIDNSHVWHPLSASVVDEALASFFKPCSSSRKIENRSSAAPKAKAVRFADTLVSEYRCIPTSKNRVLFRHLGATTASWEPSEKELEDFKAYYEMF